MPQENPLPYATTGLPGVGGRMRERIEDFIVEEIPPYPPSGGGEHTYLFVEKTGLSTVEAARRMARELGVRQGDFGFAGHKDARAVTRQWFSAPRLAEADAWNLSVPGLKLLEVARHKNRIKTGHLAGNRFEIRLRGVAPGAPDKTRAVLAELAGRGVPNYFGEQRFGARGNSDLVGREMVCGSARGALSELLGRPRPGDPETARRAREFFDDGKYAEARSAWPGRDHYARKALGMLVGGAKPEAALAAWPKRLRFLFVSACQSRLFNIIVAARVGAGGLGRLEEGDLAYLHKKGAVFSVKDAAVEQPRAGTFEISPSGPMFGYKVLLADGRPGEVERRVLAGSGLELEGFKSKLALKARGERRPLRIPLNDPSVEAGGDGGTDSILVRFNLPAGCFATTVIREITKE